MENKVIGPLFLSCVLLLDIIMIDEGSTCMKTRNLQTFLVLNRGNVNNKLIRNHFKVIKKKGSSRVVLPCYSHR